MKLEISIKDLCMRFEIDISEENIDGKEKVRLEIKSGEDSYIAHLRDYDQAFLDIGFKIKDFLKKAEK